MAVSKGKDFEKQVKECVELLPNTYILRLYDTMNGYQRITNPCDFIVVRDNKTYLVECKSTKGHTFNFSGLSQYEKLLNAYNKNVNGLNVCILLWFIDHQETYYVPISYVKYLKDTDAKSINIKYLKDDIAQMNGVKLIPGTTKRVFTDYDFDTIF